MEQYIVSVAARDRAGIVAGVSEAVLELNGNIEAASQTVHQGYFTMMILCAFPAKSNAEKIVPLIQAKAGADMHVYITPYIKPTETSSADMQEFIVSAKGPDRPGIMYALTSYLASKNINIDDLYARGEGKDFVVICQVSVPAGMDVYMLQADLEAAGETLGLAVHMQHENVFVATNELRFGRAR